MKIVMVSKDFREVIAEEEYGESVSGDKAVKTKKALSELESHYSGARNRSKAIDEETLLVNYFEADDLIEIQHTFEKEIPYNVQATLQHADFVVTDTERVYEEDADIVRTVIWAGPRGVVEDGNRPATTNALKKQSKNSKTSSSSSRSRNYTSSRSQSNRQVSGVSRPGESSYMMKGFIVLLNAIFMQVIVDVVLEPMLASEAVTGAESAEAAEVLGLMTSVVDMVVFLLMPFGILMVAYGFMMHASTPSSS